MSPNEWDSVKSLLRLLRGCGFTVHIVCELTITSSFLTMHNMSSWQKPIPHHVVSKLCMLHGPSAWSTIQDTVNSRNASMQEQSKSKSTVIRLKILMHILWPWVSLAFFLLFFGIWLTYITQFFIQRSSSPTFKNSGGSDLTKTVTEKVEEIVSFIIIFGEKWSNILN